MTSINETWDKITLGSARFILDQAEKNLAATIETARILTDRALNVLQFSIPFSLALIGVLAAKMNTLLVSLSIVGLIFSLIISWKAFRLYELYKVHPLGNLPSKLLIKENLETDEKFQELAFIFSTIQGIEKAIDINEAGNSKRQRIMYSIMEYIKYGILITFLFPLIRFLFAV